MRFIVKNYLLTLKEKDELDLLLCDILLQDGFIIDSIPKTGNRQFGVDILAHSKSEVLFFVVKQGNIDRKMWDDGQNSVRQSMNEILDVTLRNMPSAALEKDITIVVATNGYLDDPVRLNWQGYQEQHRNYNGLHISYKFWGIDEITEQVQQTLLSENLFPLDMRPDFRKALYFVEESDYKNSYYENIINTYIQKLPTSISQHSIIKIKTIFPSLMLGAQMIAQYAASVNRFQISSKVFEYTVIKVWKWMLQNNGMEKKICSEWLIKFLNKYREWNQQYYEAIKDCCLVPKAFPSYFSVVEQKIKLYDVVGQLSSFAFVESYIDSGKANTILNTIVQLVNNNPQFFYAPYDNNIVQTTILCRAFIACGRRESALNLIHNQCIMVSEWFHGLKKYPTPTDSFRDAINIELGNTHDDYVTSSFWGFMLLWIGILNDSSTYESVKSFLENDLKDVTKCVWILRAQEELSLYDEYAMYKSGEGIVIKTEDNFDSFKEKLLFILDQYQNEVFSFDEYSFPALEIITSHYYNSIPRIKLD